MTAERYKVPLSSDDKKDIQNACSSELRPWLPIWMQSTLAQVQHGGVRWGRVLVERFQ